MTLHRKLHSSIYYIQWCREGISGSDIRIHSFKSRISWRGGRGRSSRRVFYISIQRSCLINDQFWTNCWNTQSLHSNRLLKHAWAILSGYCDRKRYKLKWGKTVLQPKSQRCNQDAELLWGGHILDFWNKTVNACLCRNTGNECGCYTCIYLFKTENTCLWRKMGNMWVL